MYIIILLNINMKKNITKNSKSPSVTTIKNVIVFYCMFMSLNITKASSMEVPNNIDDAMIQTSLDQQDNGQLNEINTEELTTSSNDNIITTASVENTQIQQQENNNTVETIEVAENNNIIEANKEVIAEI